MANRNQKKRLNKKDKKIGDQQKANSARLKAEIKKSLDPEQYQKKAKKGKNGQKIRKKFAAQNFLFLTFMISWVIGFSFYKFDVTVTSTVGFLMKAVIIFIPAIVTMLIYNKTLTQKLNVSLSPSPWFLVALFLPVGFSLASIYVSGLMEGISVSWGMEDHISKLNALRPADQPMPPIPTDTMHPYWQSLLMGAVIGGTLHAFFAMGEEVGFRGLLHREWKEMGFWPSSLLIGLVWGVWYTPLVLMGHNYPENPQIGVAMMIAYCVMLSPSVQWVREKSNSIVAGAIFVGTMNGAAASSMMLLNGGGELTNGLLGSAGLLVLAAFNLILLFTYKGNAAKA